MKIVRFRLKPEAETFYGVLDGLSIKRLSAEPYDGLHFTGDEYAADSVIFDAPCEPSKIVAVGKNYRAHADEMGEGFPPEPLLFLKPSTSVIACGEAVIYPEISHRLDYEGELAVVIGKKMTHVKAANGHITFKKAAQPSTFSVIPALTMSLHATFKSPIPNGRAARALILSARHGRISKRSSAPKLRR